MIEYELSQSTAGPAPQEVRFDRPRPEDGRRVFEAVRTWGGLDLNSPYAYLLACDRFRNRCCLAERDGQLLGFSVGLTSPEDPRTLFIWQVGVSPAARGQRIALAMIDATLARGTSPFDFVEAHVGPRNQSSMRLFEGLARHHGTNFVVRDAYPASWFPPGHDAEQLVRVGPLPAVRNPLEC